jgi:FtsZ-binding cell division protein ZapB
MAKKDSAVMENALKNIQGELTAIKSKLDKVDLLESKLDRLQAALDQLSIENIQIKSENASLKSDLAARDQTIEQLQNGLNQLERHQRSWSIRIHGIPLSNNEEKDPQKVMKKIYDLLFLPILRGALANKEISAVPDYDQIFETAHVLPGKNGAHKPIIARFYNRNMKALCFKYRKEFAPRVNNGAVTRRGGRDNIPPQRQCFPFQDDLPKATLDKMKEIQADSSVQSCWSISGQLRFKLKNSETVKKVNSVFDPLEKILGS